MAKFEWIDKLNKYLLSILNEEKAIEYERQYLGRIPEFEPYAAFQRFDRDNKKFINADDIKLFLKENNTKYSDLCLREFIRQYDRNNDGVLSFEEFLAFVLTKSDNDLRALVTQRDNYIVSPFDFLVPEIEESLTRLLKMELNFAEDMMSKSESVKYLYGYNNRDAFKQIDYLNYGHITYEELAVYMKRNGLHVSDYEIYQLFNRLDRDCDGKISFKDFQGLFFPEKKYNTLKTSSSSKSFKNESNLIRPSQLTKNGMSFMSNRKENLSPMRQSLEFRASLNSYTSPIRSQRGFNYVEPNRTFNDEIRLASPNRSINNSLNRSLTSLKKSSPVLYKSEERELNNQSPSSHFSRKTGLIDYESILANYFTKLISICTNAETAKETFALKCDCDINTLFSIFDPFKYSSINIFDFKDGLAELDIFATTDEIRLLFRRYDLNRDDKLSFTEFTEMICSIKSEYSKLITNKKIYSTTTIKDISNETKKNFAELLRALINTETQVETLRKISTDKPTFIISSAFDVLKARIKNYASRDDVN